MIFGLSLRVAIAALALAIVFVLTVVASQPAQAQTFNVLHNFTGGQDGANPYAGVTLRGGNLYGTAFGGGLGYGTVYQLKHIGSNWVVNPLYSFTGGSDGNGPLARVIFGPNGTLYGTTVFGGTYNAGTVFNLRPQARACRAALCPWGETVLYAFNGGAEAYPYFGDLLFDQAGNIYGTTEGSGYPYGSVYELTPSGSESVLYTFSGNDGAYPLNGVTFDNAGNLYGTTQYGGLFGYGTVFELTHSIGWTETCLNSFQGGILGFYPLAGLISDPSGNFYGATITGGTGGGGTVFELTPGANCNWTFTLIYSFTGACGPYDTLAMDGAGNLYGTTYCDGANHLGSVFKLTPSGNSWTYTSLHDFTGGSDGKNPYGNVAFDANGNLYGTAYAGGSQTVGVVWEITFP